MISLVGKSDMFPSTHLEVSVPDSELGPREPSADVRVDLQIDKGQS